MHDCIDRGCVCVCTVDSVLVRSFQASIVFAALLDTARSGVIVAECTVRCPPPTHTHTLSLQRVGCAVLPAGLVVCGFSLIFGFVRE